MKTNNFDVVLMINQDINEDNRSTKSDLASGVYTGDSQYFDRDDPRLYSSNNFGRIIQNELNRLGDGITANVTDFGKWVTVNITCHNYKNGQSASKTFLIVFSNDTSGIVLSTCKKWRTINGVSQASNYIKQIANSLKNNTKTNL